MRPTPTTQDILDRHETNQSKPQQWHRYSDSRLATLGQRVGLDCGTDDEELSHVAVLGYN
ncbi:hypothetical protein [Cupriavidus sp. BIC8F]|uniref:hypothetical protein n=1 Tax=Cupriavidus sp. BIC8F TaxID=3079014 RepID=UPI0029163064|nr:hypothetical protein [Cupriavidus sp. BIC8F]